MLIATRVLTLRGADGDTEIPVRLHAPQEKPDHWSCEFEIGWPEGGLTRAASGEDSVQALELAMRMIGALIYTSDHHEVRQSDVVRAREGLRLPGPK